MQEQLVPVYQLESYRKLIAKLAWRTWRNLPVYVRSWIGVEDIIEDGMTKAFKYATKRYDPDRSKFITGLYHAVHNHFITQYIEWYGNEKRGVVEVPVEIVVKDKRTGKLRIKTEMRKRATPIVSIEAERERVREEGLGQVEASIPNLALSEYSLVRTVISECFVIPALEQVYKESSPKLQQAIVAWFLRSGGAVVSKAPNRGSRKFDRLSYEFRDLCSKHHVDCEDCIHVVRSPTCLDTLSRKLLWVPYDLNNPTPFDLQRSKQLREHLTLIGG